MENFKVDIQSLEIENKVRKREFTTNYEKGIKTHMKKAYSSK